MLSDSRIDTDYWISRSRLYFRIRVCAMDIISLIRDSEVRLIGTQIVGVERHTTEFGEYGEHEALSDRNASCQTCFQHVGSEIRI